PDQAMQLRATVASMGKDVEWFEQTERETTSPQWHRGPEPTTPVRPMDDEAPARPRRRTWPYVAAIAALALTGTVVWQNASDDQNKQDRQEKATAYKGVSATDLTIDGVETETRARWSKDGQSVVLSVWIEWDERAKFVRIDSGEQKAQEQPAPLKEGEIPAPVRLEVKVPVKDWYEAVRMTVAVGGPEWKEGTRAPGRTIEFRPDRTAIDTETGKQLKQRQAKLL
ncbi:hypothetical protein, partial [Streptomyces parvulus]